MRRTKATQIYKKTGNLRAVQLLLGHTKMDSTVRYLGVELEDALAIAEAIEILQLWVAFTDGPNRSLNHVLDCCSRSPLSGHSLQAGSERCPLVQ